MKRKHKIAIAIALVSTAAAATTSYYATQKAGPADIYPHSAQTGFANPDITQANIQDTICNPSFRTGTIRPPVTYTNQLKLKQIQEYGYTDTNPASYEEDHIIALTDGGNPTDERNLWPQPYNASIPDGGAKTKDTLEVFVHKQICSGAWTLQQGQDCLAQDWYGCYQKNMKGKLGGIGQNNDSDDQ